MSDRRYKVTEKQIAQMRTEYAQGKTFIELAKKYRITTTYVWKLIHGLSHKRLAPLICPNCHTVINHF